jgi:hypothetical protein
MALGGVESALSTIAACGGVGAFIDFWIGKRDEKRVRDWLETWWLRLSYVNWGNLGREEALFAIQVIDYLFGRKFFSPRRMIAATALTLACHTMTIAIYPVLPLSPAPNLAEFHWQPLFNVQSAVSLALDLLSVSASLSITRFAAVLIARIVTRVPLLNLVGLLFLVAFQYVLFCIHPLLIGVAHYLLFMSPSPKDFVQGMWEMLGIIFEGEAKYAVRRPFMEGFSMFLMLGGSPVVFPYILYSFMTSALINGMRLLISAFFVGSFMLKPAQRSLMTLWARIIESDKPIFTLLFGAAAAAAKGIQALVQAL